MNLFNTQKESNFMTISQIINEALQNPENYYEDGSINWNFVDADLWMHPQAKFYTDEEKLDGLKNFNIKTGVAK
tara:strand:+ start:206 stop:427 length:222 start_codon:yes stop_codon:yes gene_type:complete